MDINSIKLVCFSPTGTTRKVVEGIAHGVNSAMVERIDLTPPGSGMGKLMEMHEELTILGSPVYGGRLPVDVISRLHRLKGNDTPAVIVVVYGNRAYEDALLELNDLALETGFKPVAAGVFIGEHSYSTDAMPTAAGRPDPEDLRKAMEFGKQIREKLSNMQKPLETPLLQVPGNFPYKKRVLLSNISPVTQETVCAKCETCASVCPTAAIVIGDAVMTDSNLCIRCCACIRNCSTGARLMEDTRIRQLAEWLNNNCRDRKEPEVYI